MNNQRDMNHIWVDQLCQAGSDHGNAIAWVVTKEQIYHSNTRGLFSIAEKH